MARMSFHPAAWATSTSGSVFPLTSPQPLVGMGGNQNRGLAGGLELGFLVPREAAASASTWCPCLW